MRKGGQYRADDDGNIVKVEPQIMPPKAPADSAPVEDEKPDRVDGPATPRGRQSKKG